MRREYFSSITLCLAVAAFAWQSAGCGGSDEAPSAKLPVAPKGLPAVPVPQDNPVTAEKVELGKLLYFDKRLSKDGTISCATCHDPQMGWAERKPTSTGINGQVGGRNAPSVINTAYFPELFWDGRAKSLEEQALGPVANPIEMGNTIPGMIDSVKAVAGYKPLFKAAFGDEGITRERVAQAIASFERTVLSGNSPYDRHQSGDTSALTEAEKRGLEVFAEKADCDMCHAPPLFSNGQYINAGVGMDKPEPDEGLKTQTNKDGDRGKFRVPALRDVADTAPYFHDGSAKTLEEAVEFMAAGGKDNPNLSAMMKAVGEAKLTDQDKKDLVAFLKALSGDYPKTEPPKLP